MTEELEITNPDFSTPMMQQYMKVKAEYPDCLLLFRLGDFYEMFLDDAHIGAEVLDITLTGRARGKDGKIPMAGIPFHALDNYLFKLIEAGYKVAICEQVTAPTGKGLVEREVIRVVTAGTVLDEKTLRKKANNYILSLQLEKNSLGVSAADLSTGEFLSGEIELDGDQSLEQNLSHILTQLQPSECIFPPGDNINQILEFLRKYTSLQTSPFPNWTKWSKKAEKILKQYFGPVGLTEFETPANKTSIPVSMKTAAALLGYLEETQKTVLSHIKTVTPFFGEKYLRMDRSTVANLELFNNLLPGQSKGSLLDVIDFTVTAMGGRELKKWLRKPLVQKNKIDERLETLSYFLQYPLLRQEIRQVLTQIIDIERVVSRLSVRLGSPKDLKSLQNALDQTIAVRELISDATPLLLQHIYQKISTEVQSLASKIQETLVEDPPFDPRQTGLIQTGLHSELDELRQTVNSSREWIAKLEAEERQKTGISSLKIKYNQVFGFYIEISKPNLPLVPDYFMRKQTLVNAERFITPDLKTHEEIILNAEEKMKEFEYQFFLDLVTEVLKNVTAIQQTAQSIAQLDCLLSLAELAERYKYAKPVITEDGELKITAGRHPVLEQLIEDHQFIPNDVFLNTTDQQMILITGPNMAGKSVLMRQVTLITLLAHIGSYVPAEAASISITDQIFVRSGAADMITAGLSTFMVEMVETAYILKNVTENSLVIMDEIGRGTSTYDGISIAWAVAEHLVKNCDQGPKTLFATHYHELQALADECPDRIKNYHMAITEYEGKPVFLYTFTEGGASHSFGVAVAELAGLPEAVVDKARELLKKLEVRGQPAEATTPQKQPPSEILQDLAKLPIDKLTPLEALNTLAQWKAKIKV